jgi:hypothetical protein
MVTMARNIGRVFFVVIRVNREACVVACTHARRVLSFEVQVLYVLIAGNDPPCRKYLHTDQVATINPTISIRALRPGRHQRRNEVAV